MAFWLQSCHAGNLEVRCAATGMSAAITFSPAAVRGTVSRLQGQGGVQIAEIDGSLADTIEVIAPEWEARGEDVHTYRSV